MGELNKKLPVLNQIPNPGAARVLYCGDSIAFTLELSPQTKGRAWIRTNLGTSDIARKEIIDRIEKNEIKLDQAWHDIPMPAQDNGNFKIVLPLHQTGFFQAKCFFIPENSHTPVWPSGDNTIMNIEPAGTCCANIIYNAFVRQFGRSKSLRSKEIDIPSLIETLDTKGYTVIPESGKFRDLKQEVGFIFSRLGCRALHLLPIHPTPTTYARMGRFGSPYAALNFTDVDPALAVFDPAVTPLEQFLELVDAVHFHSGYLIMDIAINHTGWAATIHETNPEWLVRGEDGKIKAPGAWGVVWSDLTKLDYSNIELWKYMANVFLLWCHRGVDGFRCDAGYMIPVQAWEYIVAKVRQEYPNTLFFLEGLGGPLETTKKLLNRANFNWAYSELFQHYTREEITGYLPFAFKMSDASGHLIHFAETHDNNRLASVSIPYAKMRTALCALFSICGGFGFTNGVEWFADEKINVHESNSLNWGNKPNQVDHIARLNMILKNHSTFFAGTRLKLIQENRSPCLVLLRHNPESDKRLLILVNLDCDHSQKAFWQPAAAGISAPQWYDLITGMQFAVKTIQACHAIALEPGEVLALTPDDKDLERLSQHRQMVSQAPDQVLLQKRKANVLSIYTALKGFKEISGLDIHKEALRFAENPIEFIRNLNSDSRENRVIVFDVKKDLTRQLMIPPGFFLMVRCQKGFRAELIDESRSQKKSLGYEEGILTQDKTIYVAIFRPQKIKKQHKEYLLRLRVFDSGQTHIEKASVIYLAPMDKLMMRLSFTRKEIAENPSLKLLCTTNIGGMMRAAACWGQLESRYDALMGANMNTLIPENRWMVLSRYRIWAIFQGYSRELTLDCLQAFWFSFDQGGKWRFHVPSSDGKYYVLDLYLSMDRRENNVRLYIQREKSTGANTRILEDDKPISLIIRPDIEDRNFHDTVK
ncbi:MAG: glycogen debranching enzyme N-terminal domain-containing protein, partial [Desulfobacula sp.]|nr:glycogen debranching enzyme N-terminal domain-containing protein [Desulfobacula sp.]